MGSLFLLLAACGDEPPPPCEPTWQTLVDDSDPDTDDLNAAVLGVWGASAHDLWLSGGTIGVEPRAPLAMHFDGHTWERIAIDVPQTLWWVTQTPEGTVFFVGEEGTAVRWDGEATVYDTGATTTLFGAWGCSDTDVWAVGGDVGAGEKDVIVHFDGDAWSRVPSPEAFDVQFLKIWGASCEAVWLVGGGGTILFWNGQSWTVQESGTHAQLVGISGRAADDVWVAGASTTVLHFDGTAWAEYEGDLVGGLLQGVSAPAGGDVFTVGIGGAKIVITPDDGAFVMESLSGTTDDLHGVWADANGIAFAVGGDYADTPDTMTVRPGTIAYRGCDVSTEGLPARPTE